MCVKKKKEENHISNENVFKSTDDCNIQLTNQKKYDSTFIMYYMEFYLF